MKKSDIPKAVYSTIKEFGFKVSQKRNGDITICKGLKHPMPIEFLNEEQNSFRFKLWIGELTDELQMKAAGVCCIKLNPTFYLTKLMIEKKGGKHGLCAVIDHMCYTQTDVHKFIPLAKDLIVGDSIKAIDFINEKVAQLRNAG